MAPSKTGKAAAANEAKNEKVHHPASRKAGQFARKALRKGKLGKLAAKRGQRHDSLVDFYGFFYHAMPEEGVLTLHDLHDLICDFWLARFDEELESEKAARRKGRPKGTRELQLEDLKLREAEQYRTGMEIIDLTHAPTVEIFRRWDQKEVAFIQLLRFIRIFRNEPDRCVVSRPGKHVTIVESIQPTLCLANDSMDIVPRIETNEASKPSLISTPSVYIPLLQDPVARFSSTMMAMDEASPR